MNHANTWPVAFIPTAPDPWESRDMQLIVEGRVMGGLHADAEQIGAFAIVRANPERPPTSAIMLPDSSEIGPGIAVELGGEFVYPLGDGKIARWTLQGTESQQEMRARRVSGVLRWWVEQRKGAANG